MAAKRSTSLERVLGRLDSLDSSTMANLVQRLAEERRFFEQVFDVLQEGVLVIGADGEITYSNAAARRLVGLGETGRESLSLWRLIPNLRASLQDVLDGKMTGQFSVTREIELSYPEARTVRLYLVPMDKNGDGADAAKRFAVILSDLTKDKKLTEDRIEDERASSVLLLAAGVAHELGNPLNSLTIHLQLIARKLRKLTADGRGQKDAAALGESIRICQEEVERLDGTITHFLEAIRPRPPDLAETHVAEVLAEVLSFQSRELEDRGITVEADFSGQLPVVMADRNQLKQVFFNLVKNAMEAMGPGGCLRIRAYADDTSVHLTFADDGSGIKQTDLAKLFQPYHTTKSDGHGLGLMIVQRVMRDHGGQIAIESKEGLGTTVKLQFPRKDRRLRMLE